MVGLHESPEVQSILKELSDIVVNTKQDCFSHLEHPGHVYHFQKQDKFNIFYKDEKEFSDCVPINRNMVFDHFEGGYVTALNGIQFD